MNVRRPEADDLDAVLDVCRAADVAVIGESDWTRRQLEGDWQSLGDDTGAWVVEFDGRIAGYALYEERSGGRAVGDGYVHPELRGRGVGARLLALVEERARERGRNLLSTGCLAEDEAAARLFACRGFARVEHFFRMVVDLPDELPEPDFPEGLSLATYTPADLAALHDAFEESFAEEPGHRPATIEEFASRMRGERFDPTLVWLVRGGADVVAFASCWWKRLGDWGWVGALGVRRAWRRRGLGEALLRTAFREFRRRGETRVALGVNARNPAAATRLYERVGMRVLWRADVWEKAL